MMSDRQFDDAMNAMLPPHTTHTPPVRHDANAAVDKMQPPVTERSKGLAQPVAEWLERVEELRVGLMDDDPLISDDDAFRLALLRTLRVERDFVSAIRTLAHPPASASPEPGARESAYDMIDRYLRNNMGDDDYAEYSTALDTVYAAAPRAPEAEPGAVEALAQQIADALYEDNTAIEAANTDPEFDAVVYRAAQAKVIAGVLRAAAPRADAPDDLSELSREQLETAYKRLRQNSEAARAFFDRYRKPPLSAPSCLRCGKQTSEFSVQHMELPSIVLCAECAPRADAQTLTSCGPAGGVTEDAARWRWLRMQPYETFTKIGWTTWDVDADVASRRDQEVDALSRRPAGAERG